MGLMDKLQAKMEINRIEDRYVKRVNRNAFASDAQYVNGEYVFKCRQSVESPPSRSLKQPTSSKPSKSSSSNSISKTSTNRSSSSRDSDLTISSGGSGKSGSTSKWSVFS
ncbi:putative mannosyl-oligosaccharide alpha-1-2-mannosidase [Venturia nashicola]|uniref:Putative mannosyl-oligosaccharide alpha-1-2-mannosidase n=1 Tax=Venturia nashicola TaxID=86259 RepID=A0A4Z1P111_9PEZI|nr:putative mannosyl-oligosaccharide alpha-1-2-mannosidase [Venturia nashicola]TLD35250.1 putative mannosyl-oligosaccharide alpha-1-2-mannosidase [Venturia nashicola]